MVVDDIPDKTDFQFQDINMNIEQEKYLTLQELENQRLHFSHLECILWYSCKQKCLKPKAEFFYFAWGHPTYISRDTDASDECIGAYLTQFTPSPISGETQEVERPI
jgi:hypothetical protein